MSRCSLAKIHTTTPIQADSSDLARQAALIVGQGDLTWCDWTHRSPRCQQTLAVLRGMVGS
ncbi:MAG: hypothetical protein H7832_15580 [Magnetococcus sp. DMHC-6]